MAPKLWLLLVTGTLLGLPRLATGNGSNDKAQCSVIPGDRIECGYAGISSEECRSRGCCFDSSIRGVKWCFRSNDYNEAQCSVSPADRK
ncbi:trefoil factor 3-like [Rana temporaria]|uniref:trefoil factor 3-like n=1 Tax=Rana temporaria TaxID=8407 RepID=UPI001AADB81A|nr:trefoil factor 3-like [Rana temporaria]